LERQSYGYGAAPTHYIFAAAPVRGYALENDLAIDLA